MDRLAPDDWTKATECTGWDVKDVVSHLLGWMEANADPAEAGRQFAVASRTAQEQGILRLDAQTALHVREHAHLSPAELTAAMHEGRVGRWRAGPRATAEVRATTFSTGLPGEGDWTRGYLIDVVLTRDCGCTGWTSVGRPDNRSC